jgi:hypothetical protein
MAADLLRNMEAMVCHKAGLKLSRRSIDLWQYNRWLCMPILEASYSNP